MELNTNTFLWWLQPLSAKASQRQHPLLRWAIFLLTLRSVGGGRAEGRTDERKGHLMHSKQLKHFKPLNPDRRRERKGKSDRERCDERVGGGSGGAKGESFSQWEMTNAICPEHSACVNPPQVPAGPHPTLRPLYTPFLPPPTSLSASTGRVDPSHRSSAFKLKLKIIYFLCRIKVRRVITCQR